MKTNKNLLAVAAVAICCLIVVWLSTSIHGSQRTYELQPWISVPEYRTDAARAIDAYERLMDRYIDLTESNVSRLGTDIRDVVKRLDSIDARLARLEKALGIEQPKPPDKQNTQPEAAGK